MRSGLMSRQSGLPLPEINRIGGVFLYANNVVQILFPVRYIPRPLRGLSHGAPDRSRRRVASSTAAATSVRIADEPHRPCGFPRSAPGLTLPLSGPLPQVLILLAKELLVLQFTAVSNIGITNGIIGLCFYFCSASLFAMSSASLSVTLSLERRNSIMPNCCVFSFSRRQTAIALPLFIPQVFKQLANPFSASVNAIAKLLPIFCKSLIVSACQPSEPCVFSSWRSRFLRTHLYHPDITKCFSSSWTCLALVLASFRLAGVYAYTTSPASPISRAP